MQTTEKLPAVEKALAFVKAKIDNGIWKDGQRLPSYKSIALQAGVGQNNMWKALSILKEQNLVSIKQNSGIYVGTSIPQKKFTDHSEKVLRWESIKTKILQDILKGNFHGSEHIPASKELMAQYGVDYATLQKALRSLAAENILVYDKRRYRIYMYPPQSSQNTICIIISEQTFAGNYRQHQREHFNDFVGGLEKTCSEKKIHLIKIVYQPGFETTIDMQAISGFILWNCEQLLVSVKEIVFSLLKFKKPISILNLSYQIGKETGKDLAKMGGKDRNLFISDVNTDFVAGYEIGKMLLSRGHTRVCFLNFMQHPDTMQEPILPPFQSVLNRFKGLRKAFALDPLSTIIPMVWADIPETKRNPLKTTIDKNHERAIQKEVSILDSWRESIDSFFQPPGNKQLGIHLFEAKIYKNLRSDNAPILRKALTMKDVSAWVFMDDELAMYAGLEFLRAENIKIPQQIAIAGFGDFPDSKMRGLTTYHFDYSGAARKMVSLILYPEYSRRALCIKGTNFFEIDGMVIDRGSI